MMIKVEEEKETSVDRRWEWNENVENVERKAEMLNTNLSMREDTLSATGYSRWITLEYIQPGNSFAYKDLYLYIEGENFFIKKIRLNFKSEIGLEQLETLRKKRKKNKKLYINVKRREKKEKKKKNWI